MFGPLFGKELLEIARRRRYFVARFAVGVALFAGWWMTFGGRELKIEFGRLSELAAIGRMLFEGWAAGAMLVGALLAPALACGLIAGEKDNRTFDVLLTTLLNDREILLGKIASRMAFLLVLLASSVPILSLASLYGGFDAIQVIATAGTVFGLSLFALLVGLYYSTITFKPYVALLRAYFALAVMWLLIPAIPNQEWWTVPFSPRIALLSASNVMAESPGSRTPMPIWRGAPGRMMAVGIVTPISPNGQLPAHNLAATALVHFSLGVLILWRTAYLLRRRLQPGKPPWIFRALKRLYAALIGGARGFVERRQKSVGLGQLWRAEAATMRWAEAWRSKLGDRNPLGLRNATANVYDPERYITAFQLISALVVVVGFVLAGLFFPAAVTLDTALAARLLSWTFAAHLICSMVLAACAFARERQSGSWDLVMLADLPPRAHAWSAFWGLLRVMRPLMVLLAILWVMTANITMFGEGVTLWTMLAACVWLNAVALALCASVCHQRVAGAIGAAFGGWLLLPVAESVTAALFHWNWRAYAWVMDYLREPAIFFLLAAVVAAPVLLVLVWAFRWLPRYWALLIVVMFVSRGIVTHFATAHVFSQMRYAQAGLTYNIMQPHRSAMEYVTGLGQLGQHPFFGRSHWHYFGSDGQFVGVMAALLSETVLFAIFLLVFFPRLQPRRAESKRSIWPMRRAVVK